jgi:hypothetical protein
VIHPVIDLVTDQDEVRGSFPDGEAGKPGSGTIDGHYFASQPVGTPELNGSVNYSTSATHNPYNGASVVSIALTVTLRPIAVRDHGYEWFAVAGAGEISASSQRIEGTAPSGGTLNFEARFNLKDDPPTVILS